MWTARDFFAATGDGTLRADTHREYLLEDAIKAHEVIESGSTPGAPVPIP